MERSVIPGQPIPDYAALHPGYGLVRAGRLRSVTFHFVDRDVAAKGLDSGQAQEKAAEAPAAA